MSKPLYTCLESAEITSPLNFLARAIARPVLPEDVGPTTTIIFGDEKQVRDFIYIDDVIEANIQAMLSDIKVGFFNIGTSVPTSILELANMMIKLSNNDFEPIFEKSLEGDVRMSQADITKTKNVLNWESKIKLEDGLSVIFNK